MFDTTIPLRSIPNAAPLALRLTADGSSRAILANRFGWLEVAALDADLQVMRIAADTYDVTGTVSACLIQQCRSTGNPVAEEISIAVHERFLYAPDGIAGGDADMDIDPEAVSVEVITTDAIPIGETIAQLAGIHADPWPQDTSAAAGTPADTTAELAANRPFASLAEWQKRK